MEGRSASAPEPGKARWRSRHSRACRGARAPPRSRKWRDDGPWSVSTDVVGEAASAEHTHGRSAMDAVNPCSDEAALIEKMTGMGIGPLSSKIIVASSAGADARHSDLRAESRE